MKTQISALDLYYLIQEMHSLDGGRVDRIYHPDKDELVIQFFLTGKGKSILRIISGKFIFLSDYKGIYDQPSGFCMYLRKHIENSRLSSISQLGSERIVKLIFEQKETKIFMYIELFGKGNIILTDKEDIILNALTQQKWTDRTIAKGEKYNFPNKKLDFFKIEKKQFVEILASNTDLVLKLAKELGLGGTFAEELITRSGIKKDKKLLETTELDKLFKLFQEIKHEKINASIYYEKNKIKDVVPFELISYKNLEKRNFLSFNEAFDYFFKQDLAKKQEFTSKHQTQIDKTRLILDQQQKQIDHFEKKAEDEKKKGELIYENYQLLDDILKQINKAREKYSFDEIKEKLKGHKTVKEVDGKNKKVVVVIDS